ncbi:MAG: DUF6491 family protein [Sphingomonadaceae bacterium]
MPITRVPVPVVPAVALLAGCTAGGESPADPSVWVAKGDPVSCITRSRIRSIRVIDDQTIDFEMNSRQRYRNELPFRCSGLTFGSTIQHRSRTSQLCSGSTFTVRSMGGAPSGPSCSLGRFQPLVRVPAP